MAINKISAQALAAMRRKSAAALPDRPSQRGYTPEDIRKAISSPILDGEHSLAVEIDRVVEEANEDIGGLDARTREAETRLDDGEAWRQEADGRLDSLDVWLGDLESSTEEMQENLEELTDSVALIGKRSIISMVTINPSEWSDADPYVAFGSIFVGYDNPYSSGTILLIPRDPQTRSEARKMELSVNYAYPSSVLLTFLVNRTEYEPTVPLNFAALTILSDTSPGDTGYSIAAAIVGVTELPDELMDKEVLRVLATNKYANEERVTELINEALGVIENGAY